VEIVQLLVPVLINWLTLDLAGTGCMLSVWEEKGSRLNWSSITIQFWHDAIDKINLDIQLEIGKLWLTKFTIIIVSQIKKNMLF